MLDRSEAEVQKKQRRQKSTARPRSHTPLTSNRDHITEAAATHSRPRAGSPTSAGLNPPAARHRLTQNLLSRNYNRESSPASQAGMRLTKGKGGKLIFQKDFPVQPATGEVTNW
ncbi:hypothetical protein fugu_003034 [Takifugu bimaculatus]|uniref:Uncharacterized protein n=1 Tax=Takifugu bimaculatus TaxID=433685 RepID=A0A4Z2BES4_9TELE|nr:hypothetical protein fugu_003034 [Takifugu bimaculatus]